MSVSFYQAGVEIPGVVRPLLAALQHNAQRSHKGRFPNMHMHIRVDYEKMTGKLKNVQC